MTCGHFPTRKRLKSPKVSKLIWHFEIIFWLFPKAKLLEVSILNHTENISRHGLGMILGKTYVILISRH